MSEVEIFTPTGVLAGETQRVPLTSAGPDLTRALAVEEGRWFPLDGAAPTHVGDTTIAPDDILLIVATAPESELKVHMALYPVTLELGPYRVSGQLGTHPGFDPARAIARPTSMFVALSDATIELLARDETDAATRAHLHVNRYAVERVTSGLMLGYLFPGAYFLGQEPVPVAVG